MIEVIEGDCRNFEPADAREMQLVVADLPYSEHVHANITSAGTLGEGSRGWHRQDLEFEPLSDELLAHVSAIVARTQGWALLYSDIESAHRIRGACAAVRAEFVRTELREEHVHEDECLWDVTGACDCDSYAGNVPWERWSQAQKSGDRPTQACELVSLFWGRAGSRKAWNGPGALTCFRHKAMRGAEKHRTQKPLDQALDMVSWFSNAPHLPWGEHPRAEPEGAIVTVPASVISGRTITSLPAQSARGHVLDPVAGACTTAVACALLGRSCVAIEQLTQWSDLGAKRVEAALKGDLPFFDDRARVERWCEERYAEASSRPEPKAADGSDVKTWERAQRRLADVVFVADKL